MKRALSVLYEDNHLLAVYKPAGVPTQGDQTGDLSLFEMAKSYLAEKYQKPGNVYLGLVHRLDRPTEGVVLFARTSKAASRLSEQFREGTVRKTYLALVAGAPESEHGEIESYLSPGPQNKTRVSPRPTKDSQHALLHYQRLARRHLRFPECTFLEIDPRTGRKHQIRAQLSSIGLPIVGDRKYGCRVPLKAGRIALAAVSLAFEHPTTRERMTVAWEVPESWPKGEPTRSEGNLSLEG